MKAFNLLDEQWIPTNKGLCTLKEIFEEGIIFGATPLNNIALTRLATAITAAALQLEDDDDAEDRILDLDDTRQMVLDYLNRLYDRFFLYHETNPFMQITGLESEKKFPISLLDVCATSGSEQGIITEHQKSKIETDADIALGLVSYLNFCFNSKGKVDNNITKMDSIEQKQKYFASRDIKLLDTAGKNHLNPAGPALGNPSKDSGFIHVMIMGSDVLTTCLLQTPTVNEAFELGIPVWEMEPNDIREDSENLTNTMIAQLAPMTRFININNKEFISTTGAVIGKHLQPESFLNITVKPKNKEEFKTVKSVRSGWDVWEVVPELLSSFLKKDGCSGLNRAKKRFCSEGANIKVTFPIVGSASGEVFKITEEHEISYWLDDINNAELYRQKINTLVDKINFVAIAIDKAEKIYYKKLGFHSKKKLCCNEKILGCCSTRHGNIY